MASPLQLQQRLDEPVSEAQRRDAQLKEKLVIELKKSVSAHFIG
jgi:hypothetical protein